MSKPTSKPAAVTISDACKALRAENLGAVADMLNGARCAGHHSSGLARAWAAVRGLPRPSAARSAVKDAASSFGITWCDCA